MIGRRVKKEKPPRRLADSENGRFCDETAIVYRDSPGVAVGEQDLLTDFQTRPAPLESLEGLLPSLLNDLSLARAQIAIDQIRGAIAAQTRGNIVFLTASPVDSIDTPVAALIAIRQPGHDRAQGPPPTGTDDDSPSGGDSATIIHAGWLKDRDEPRAGKLMSAVCEALDREMASHGVRFLQWATDSNLNADDTVFPLERRFGIRTNRHARLSGG